MSEAERTGVLCMDGWAGRMEVPVTIIGETPQRYRVILGRDCRLTGGRWGKAGETVLVPKYAVRVDSSSE
jgi:hypothetical protein